jgi:hypothetical protein
VNNLGGPGGKPSSGNQHFSVTAVFADSSVHTAEMPRRNVFHF